MYRIGQSSDIHQFAQGRTLVLGGVHIPYERGLLGHSDADALLHAIAESILGALALGDLGKYFPDTDPAYKGMDSMNLLQKVWELMDEEGYRINNLDALIMIEKPKMAPYIPEMKENIVHVLQCKLSEVNVKATRGEGLGFVGRQEGVLAQAIVMLVKKA